MTLPVDDSARNSAARLLRWPRRLLAAAMLLLYFHYDLLLSTFAVLWDVITPRLRAQPAIVEIPLKARSVAEVLLVANLVSLTPGTLSLDCRTDASQGRTLLVHAMFGAREPDAVRRSVASMERRVLAVTR